VFFVDIADHPAADEPCNLLYMSRKFFLFTHSSCALYIFVSIPFELKYDPAPPPPLIAFSDLQTFGSMLLKISK